MATQSVGLEYLQLSALLQVDLTRSGRLRPYLAAGPAVAFYRDGEYKVVLEAYRAGVKIDYFDDYFDELTNVKDVLLEGLVAGGLRIEWGAHRMYVEARYSHAFGDTFEDVADPEAIPRDTAAVILESGQALDASPRTISLLLAYGFAFGR
jgi:hypothetical protein